MRVQDVHAHSMGKSTALSGYYFEYAIPPLEVITVLTDARVNFVLIGMHGLGGWMREPRTTHDVDLLVAFVQHRMAIAVILAAFDQLEADERDGATHLLDRMTKKLVVDVHGADRPLFKAVMKNTKLVRSKGQRYKIPSLEMALTLRFAPMMGCIRGHADKYQDAHDFMCMIKANAEIDMRKLAELGEVVFPGGGKVLIEKVEQVRQGKQLTF